MSTALDAIDLAQDCREAAQALTAVASLCRPTSNDPYDTARTLTADQVGPVFDLLARALLERIAALEAALAA